MSWLQVIVLGATGVAAMRAALERGDVDEAARQGALAGPAVVERLLRTPAPQTDRTTVLAAIAAAPLVEDRAELLDALAQVAAGPDRRVAIPAAGAARAIAREIAREIARRDRPDDLAPDDLATWQRTWAAIAMRGDRWIELRMVALDVAAALDPAGLGVELAAGLRDPEPAFRRAAATLVPLPAAPPTHRALAAAVIEDIDADVALAAAQSLCAARDATSRRAVQDALGAAGLARIRALKAAARPADAIAVRDASRCL